MGYGQPGMPMPRPANGGAHRDRAPLVGGAAARPPATPGSQGKSSSAPLPKDPAVDAALANASPMEHKYGSVSILNRRCLFVCLLRVFLGTEPYLTGAGKVTGMLLGMDPRG